MIDWIEHLFVLVEQQSIDEMEYSMTEAEKAYVKAWNAKYQEIMPGLKEMARRAIEAAAEEAARPYGGVPWLAA